MDNLSFLLGLNAGNGGGGGSTPSWSDVTGKPFSSVGEGLEVSDGALKECVPLYHEEEQGEQYTETFSYTAEKSESGYSASVDTDWRYYNMYQDPTIDFRWKLEDDTEYRITSTFYFSNDDEVYEDDGGYHWKIKVAGNASVYLIFECQDELPAEAKTEAEATVGVYIQDIVDIYHQLPAEYIQIDGSTIVNNSGYLTANIPAVPVVSATATLGSGTEVGSITIDGETTTLYAPTPSVVTANASTLTHGETIGSIEIDGVTTTFKGEYVPHKTSQLTNDADFLSASDTSITNTLSSGTAIGDLTIYGVTTSLYAPTPTSVVVTQGLTTGITVGAIDVDGVTTTLYAPDGGGSSAPRYDAGGAVGGAFTKEATFTNVAPAQIQMSVRNTDFATGMSSSNSYYFKMNVSVNGTSYPLVFKMITGSNFNWTSKYASQEQMSDYTIEGGEQIIDSTEIISTIFRITLKSGWTFADTVVSRSDYIAVSDGVKGYNINSLFIPFDNSTIKINSNGLLETAIPAAPTTTAGTLTLQATVDSSGNVTYAWV